MANEHLESIQGGEKGMPWNLPRKRRPGEKNDDPLRRYSVEGNVARLDSLIEAQEVQGLINKGIVDEVFERFEKLISLDEADAIDSAAISAAIGQTDKIEELKNKFLDMPEWAKWLDGKAEEYKKNGREIAKE